MTESRWTAPLFLAAAVLAFYAIPLFSPNTSIQGDAADVHYPLQKYVAERWRAGEVQWTPYLYGGYPILSNPKTAAWYPLNWPFLMAGVSPRVIQVEVAAHALIACLGIFLLLRKLLAHEISAFLGALAYGLSGFFTAHTSHVGLGGAAAWFPWLLLAYLRASRRPSLWNMAAGAAAGAMMILAGSVQGALYGTIGLGLFAAADPLEPVAAGGRRAGAAAGMVLGALLLSAIQIVPGLQLMWMSLPDAMAAAKGGGVLQPGALLTLFFPRPPAVDRGTRSVAVRRPSGSAFGGVGSGAGTPEMDGAGAGGSGAVVHGGSGTGIVQRDGAAAADRRVSIPGPRVVPGGARGGRAGGGGAGPGDRFGTRAVRAGAAVRGAVRGFVAGEFVPEPARLCTPGISRTVRAAGAAREGDGGRLRNCPSPVSRHRASCGASVRCSIRSI